MHATRGMNLKYIMLYSFIQKKPGSKVYMLCDSIYMKFPNRQYFTVTEMRSVIVWGLGMRLQRKLFGIMRIVYIMNVVMTVGVYTFV